MAKLSTAWRPALERQDPPSGFKMGSGDGQLTLPRGSEAPCRVREFQPLRDVNRLWKSEKQDFKS